MIIGVLSSIVYISYSGIQIKVRDNSIIADLSKMDIAQLKIKQADGSDGHAYYSGTGYDSTLDFIASEGNVVGVAVGSGGYRIRGYNTKATKNKISNAATK